MLQRTKCLLLRQEHIASLAHYAPRLWFRDGMAGERTLPELRTRAAVETVGGIFSGRYRLELPYFQRGYAWTEHHVAQLLDNVGEAMRGELGLDWYPLGVIILAHGSNAGAMLVTDGHQRLMTLTILLAVLRDLETAPRLQSRLAEHVADAAGAPRLTTMATAQDTFASHVQATGATTAGGPDSVGLTDSERNILVNRDWLRRRLGGLPPEPGSDMEAMSPEERRRLAEFVLDRCELTVVTVDSQKAARLLFTTMHDRGLRPEPGDLLKAEVLAAIDPEERGERQEAWESLEARLGRDGLEKLLSDVQTIATARPAVAGAERRLVDRLGLDAQGAAARFVDGMLKPLGDRLADVLAAPHAFDVVDGGVARRLDYLATLVIGHETWRPPLLLWLDRHGLDKEATMEFLRRLEARAFVNQLVGETPSRRDARYIRLIEEIRAGTALDQASLRGGGLGIPDGQQRQARALLTADRFLHRRHTVLLLRIDGALDGDGPIRRLPRGTTEHIYPRSPAADSRWRQDFPDGRARQLCDSLGNLALLTSEAQNLAQNRDWPDKRPVLAESPFVISRQAAGCDRWRPEDIRRRTGELAEALLASWGIA